MPEAVRRLDTRPRLWFAANRNAPETHFADSARIETHLIRRASQLRITSVKSAPQHVVSDAITGLRALRREVDAGRSAIIGTAAGGATTPLASVLERSSRRLSAEIGWLERGTSAAPCQQEVLEKSVILWDDLVALHSSNASLGKAPDIRSSVQHVIRAEDIPPLFEVEPLTVL